MRAGVKTASAFVAVGDRSVRFAKCGKIWSAPLPNGVDRSVSLVTDKPSGAKAVDEYIAQREAEPREARGALAQEEPLVSAVGQ